jgi:hypothetical protein
MALFDVIPRNFFSILSSPNREIHVEALMLLHRSFRYNFSIRLDDYLSSLIAAIEDQAFIIEEGDKTSELTDFQGGDAGGSGLAASVKARLILDRLVTAGWVDREIPEGTFFEVLTPKDYAIKFLKLLNDLTDPSVHEYNSLVFATYSSLKQAKNEHTDQMYEAILNAKANTEQLTDELQILYHGIRKYHRLVQEEHEVNKLLKNQFEKYKPMADRIYHPIKTMDSIYRYKAPIQDMLSDIIADENLRESIHRRAMAIRKYDDEAEAGEEINSALDYILTTYQTIGGMVNEIDHKNSAYTKSSTERIKYLMTADRSIQGKLVELLKAYAQGAGEKRENLLSLFKRNIRVNRQEFIDSRSLYHKNVLSRRIESEPLAISADKIVRETAMAEMMEEMKRIYPLSRIRSFISGLFTDDSAFVDSRDIPLGNDTDFILLILSLVRADERGMSYTVKLSGGYTVNNGYRIPNMRFKKKEGAHVE